MVTKKKGVGIMALIIPIITVVGVGDYYLDFSQTNTWNQNTISGDTINLESGVTCEKLKIVCKDQSSSIDPNIRKYCPMLDIMC